MKKIIILLVAVTLFACNSKKEQSTVDVAFNNLSKINVDIKCPDLNGQLPQIAIFDQNPLDLLKSKFPNLDQSPIDSVLLYWNNLFNGTHSQGAENMFPEGTLFCGDKEGKCWIATTSIVINSNIYIWSQEINRTKGSTVQLIFDNYNKIKL